MAELVRHLCGRDKPGLDGARTAGAIPRCTGRATLVRYNAPVPRETLLLLPGLLCDSHLWAAQIDALSPVAACHVVDLTQDSTVDAMAQRALRQVSGRFALAGLSMGGYVALAIMRSAPRRVTRLCLMDTSARPDTPEAARRRRGLMQLAQQGRFKGVTPRLIPSLLHPDRVRDQALGREVMAMAARVGPDAFLRQQAAILARPDSRPDLPGIAVPTLVVVGSGDQLTPPDRAKEIASTIPGARLAIVPDAGHLPTMERPEAVTALLRDWLSWPAAIPPATPPAAHG